MFKSKIYPLWLNIACLIVLLMVPIGFIMALTMPNSLTGYLIAGLGFLGITIFGEMATKISKEKE